MIPTQKHISPDRIFLVHSNDHTGHRAYYFLHVSARKLPLFKEAIGSNATTYLGDFGEVLASGYGDAPDDVCQAMRKRYGWNPAD